MGWNELDSRWLYLGLVGVVVLERFVELIVSSRNARRLQHRGAREVGQRHYPWMVALHAGLLVAAPAETWLMDRPLLPVLALPMLALLGGTMALRYWSVVTLGERWTTRVIVVPGAPLVRAGPYRWLRHPNYLAVAVEVTALPLVHTAWLTAAAFGIANTWLLRTRVRVEDGALRGATNGGAGQST